MTLQRRMDAVRCVPRAGSKSVLTIDEYLLVERRGGAFCFVDYIPTKARMGG